MVLVALVAYLERFPAGPRRAEAMFRKAEAMEKLAVGAPGGLGEALPDITAIYRRVWAEAPLEAWGDRAADRLRELSEGLPPAQAKLVRTHTAGEWMARGMVYF